MKQPVILGIDEAGRGPWAGPLVVGACILGDNEIIGLTDSKKLTKKRRQELFEEIKVTADFCGLGWVSSEELDSIGMSQALKLATKRALEGINVPYQQIIIDGTINFLADTTHGQFVATLPKADLTIPAVSAASILAKVSRDLYMEKLAIEYPGYGFEKNAGYGTAAHILAIESDGITPQHRLSFKPLEKYRPADYKGWTSTKKKILSTKNIGDQGEQAVAEQLIKADFKIIARNWKNKFAEIDIIAVKGENIFFIEVKNRLDGTGLEAINADKRHRMHRAMNYYLMTNPQLSHLNPKLIAAAVKNNGRSAILTDFVEVTD